MTNPDNPRPNSRFCTVEGVKLHWTERGKGDVVVVLHGLQDSQRTWWRVTAPLAERYRVLALDLPGCGLSSRPDASYTLDWQARLVASWLDLTGVAKMDVIAHSFGGGVAMWLLLYRAMRVRRLALVAPGGLGREVAIPLRLASIPGIVEMAGQPWMGAATDLMMLLHGRSLPREERRSLRRMNRAAGSARAFARTVRDVINWRGQTRHFSERIRDVAQLPPIALFWGENDRVLPIKQAEEVCRLLENCVLHRLPGGHFLHWQRPDALAQALLSYLDAPEMARATVRVQARNEAARALQGVRNGGARRGLVSC